MYRSERVFDTSWSVSLVAVNDGHWSLGLTWNDNTTMNNDVIDSASCTVVIDEFNFWSKFTDESHINELGN